MNCGNLDIKLVDVNRTHLITKQPNRISCRAEININQTHWRQGGCGVSQPMLAIVCTCLYLDLRGHRTLKLNILVVYERDAMYATDQTDQNGADTAARARHPVNTSAHSFHTFVVNKKKGLHSV